MASLPQDLQDLIPQGYRSQLESPARKAYREIEDLRDFYNTEGHIYACLKGLIEAYEQHDEVQISNEMADLCGSQYDTYSNGFTNLRRGRLEPFIQMNHIHILNRDQPDTGDPQGVAALHSLKKVRDAQGRIKNNILPDLQGPITSYDTRLRAILSRPTSSSRRELERLYEDVKQKKRDLSAQLSSRDISGCLNYIQLGGPGRSSTGGGSRRSGRHH